MRSLSEAVNWYQTEPPSPPQWEPGSVGLRVAPTVVPVTLWGGLIDCAFARLSLEGADCARAAGAIKMPKPTTIAPTSRISGKYGCGTRRKSCGRTTVGAHGDRTPNALR